MIMTSLLSYAITEVAQHVIIQQLFHILSVCIRPLLWINKQHNRLCDRFWRIYHKVHETRGMPYKRMIKRMIPYRRHRTSSHGRYAHKLRQKVSIVRTTHKQRQNNKKRRQRRSSNTELRFERRRRQRKYRIAVNPSVMESNEHEFISLDDPEFDSDSFQVGVDNHASFCMTNDTNDFIGDIKVIDCSISGVKLAKATMKGTVRWTIEDDEGGPHSMVIHNVHYCSTLPYRLISPQHLAKEYGDISGTGETTTGDTCTLFWCNRRYRRTLVLRARHANVPMMRTRAGYEHFMNKCDDKPNSFIKIPKCFTSTIQENQAAIPNNIITDEENSDGEESVQAESQQTAETSTEAAYTVETVDEDEDDDENNATEQHEPVSMYNAAPDAEYDGFGDIGTELEHMLCQPVEPQTPPTFENPDHELMMTHERLGHMNLEKIKELAKQGLLPRHLAKAKGKKCAACQYGKQTRRQYRHRNQNRKIKVKKVTRPGDCVSVDQMTSSTPGFIGQMRGTWLTKRRYKVATIFVDHYSRLSYVFYTTSGSGDDAIRAKQAFERFSKQNGVTVKHYHADNGIFKDNKWVNDCNFQGQTITYCGVDAHHQNGIAEKKIRDLQRMTRTQLLHCKRRWPQAVSAHLWAYSMRQANEIMINTPNADGKSPIQLFSDSDVEFNHKHYQPFGCPVFVTRRNNDKLPKWVKRSRIGIYIGQSPNHARNVALVLNPVTGLVSPQYHVVFDTNFDSVQQDSPAYNYAAWRDKAHLRGDGTDDTDGGDSKLSDDESASTTSSTSAAANQLPPATTPLIHDGGVPPTSATADQHTGTNNDNPGTRENQLDARINPGRTDTRNTSTRARRAKPTARYQEYRQKLTTLAAPFEVLGMMDAQLAADLEVQQQMDDPIRFMAASSDPDTMYYHKAQRQEDWPQFNNATKEEIETHQRRGHWVLVKKSTVPQGETIKKGVWAMKRKRRQLTNEIYKYKARLNLDGRTQVEGIDYAFSNTTNVLWPTVRIFLILALIQGWYTRQIDFVLAFPQADIETTQYMEIPKGWHLDGDPKTDCLKLLKNIYGGRAAGAVWNQHLDKGLKELGFTQSEVDPCVYFRGKVIFLVYTDDGIFLGPEQSDIEKAIKDVGERFEISDEGDLSDYLGVNIQKKEDGSFEFIQPKLINQIIKDLNFKDNTKSKPTPGLATKLIQRDDDGELHDDSFSYRGVLGRLNYLMRSSRPELAYYVHICARFCLEPKKSHAEAVKHIGRYLIGTKDKGMVFKPRKEGFDCWTDSDFCGLWNQDNADKDPVTARSRSAYYIMYAGCPVIWASKLQSICALSVTEAEYISASSALREVKFLMHLLDDARSNGIDIPKWKPKVHCRVFEDNSGALEMINAFKVRPRTKQLGVRWHHFRDEVRKGIIKAYKVTTTQQLADLGTKPLTEEIFVRLRKQLNGW